MIGYVDADHAGDYGTFNDRLHLRAQQDSCYLDEPATRSRSSVDMRSGIYSSGPSGKEAFWLRTFLQELSFGGPIFVCGDNQGALKWAESEEHHRRIKHIDVRFRFLRDVIENRSLKLEYVSMDDNMASALQAAIRASSFINTDYAQLTRVGV